MRHLPVSHRTRTVTLPGFTGGLDVSQPAAALAPDALSECTDMFRDGGALRTRAGWACAVRQCTDTGTLRLAASEHLASGRTGRRFIEKTVTGGTTARRQGVIWEDGTVTSAATTLDPDSVTLLADLGGGKAMAFTNGSAVIFDDDGAATLEPYLPLVRINGGGVASTDSLPAVPGTMFEEFNLLTPAWRETFTTDGESSFFFLCKRGVLAAISLDYVAGDGITRHHELPAGAINETVERGDGFRLTYNKALGAVGLAGYPDASRRPAAAGFSGNVTVTVRPTDTTGQARITGMTRATWYGGDNSGLSGGTRLFLTGHPDYPGLVHWSAAGEPTYFPENNYVRVGTADSGVTAFGRQGDKLILFKPREIYSLLYRPGEIDAEAVAEGRSAGVEAAAALFSLAPVHADIGCAAPDTVRLCGGRLIFLASDGRVCMLTGTGALSETNVRTLSAPVAPLLRGFTAEQRAAACACEYDGRYLLHIDGQVLVLDGQDENFTALLRRPPVWYRWTVPLDVPVLALLGSGRQAVCVTAQQRATHYVRCTHVLSGSADQPINTVTGAAGSRAVTGSFAGALLCPGGETARGVVERVWLQTEGNLPTLTCRTEWASVPQPLSGDPDGGTVSLAPGTGVSVRFGIAAQGEAPWAVRAAQIRYRQTGRMR